MFWKCDFFQSKQFLHSGQDISYVPGRTSPVFQAGHFLCSKTRKTSRVFHAGHLLCSKWDISYVPSRTSPVFEAGHFLCSPQDISCVPSGTSPMVRSPPPPKSTCHFLVNSADRPRISLNHNQIRVNLGTIGCIR